MRLKGSYLLMVLLTSAQFLAAEENEWTADDPQLPKGEVLKWCEPKTGKVRYSTEVVPGFTICGEVKTNKSCDPSGKRFISKDSNAPYAFKDCSIGKRLTVVRHDPLPDGSEPTTADQEPLSNSPEPTPSNGLPEPDPMSTKEILDAKNKFDKLQRNQEAQLAIDMQQIFQSLGQALIQANQEVEKELKQKPRRKR